MPLDKKTVGRQTTMKRAGGDAVKIRDVAPGNRAEPVDIEVRVFGFERIEGPLDQTNVAAESVLALREFELAADATVSMGGQNGKHVGMEIGGALMQPDESFREADQSIAIEGAENLAAGVVGDDEGNVGLGFEFGIGPYLASDFDAAAEVVNGVERTDGDAEHGSLVSYKLAEEAATGESLGDKGNAMLPRDVPTSYFYCAAAAPPTLFCIAWASFRCSRKVGNVSCANCRTAESLPDFASLSNSAMSCSWSFTIASA